MVAAIGPEDLNTPETVNVRLDQEIKMDPTYSYSCSGGGATQYVKHIHTRIEVPWYVWFAVMVFLYSAAYHLLN